MRFDIAFHQNALKGLKSILEIIEKVIYSQKINVPTYLLFFINQKWIRILIDDPCTPIILAIDHKTVRNQDTLNNPQSQLLIIPILDPILFFRSLLKIINRQQASCMSFSLRRQKPNPNLQQSFRYLKMEYENEQYKCEIDRPVYDREDIKDHHWINGVEGQPHQRTTLALTTEALLAILRVFLKHREFEHLNKKMTICIDFPSNEYILSLAQSNHRLIGKILRVQTPNQYEIIKYEIKAQYAKQLFEMLSKSTEIKTIIDTNYQITFVYEKQNSHLSHIQMTQYFKLIDKQSNEEQMMKMEQQ